MDNLLEIDRGDHGKARIAATMRSVNFETTDLALFVHTSDEAIDGWDRRKIVDALIREADVDQQMAETISLEAIVL